MFGQTDSALSVGGLERVRRRVLWGVYWLQARGRFATGFAAEVWRIDWRSGTGTNVPGSLRSLVRRWVEGLADTGQ